jgi:hypothetical protein
MATASATTNNGKETEGYSEKYTDGSRILYLAVVVSNQSCTG